MWSYTSFLSLYHIAFRSILIIIYISVWHRLLIYTYFKKDKKIYYWVHLRVVSDYAGRLIRWSSIQCRRKFLIQQNWKLSSRFPSAEWMIRIFSKSHIKISLPWIKLILQIHINVNVKMLIHFVFRTFQRFVFITSITISSF